MSAAKPILSLVVPVFGEAQVIGEFYRRLKIVIKGIQDELDSEIIFVDDGSQDSTAVLIRSFMAQDRSVKLVRLSRNFGHQLAITAGIDHAHGDGIIIMDGDLQDPPETIVEMLARWRQGYKVVYGIRESRKGEHVLKLATAKVFYRLIRRLSDVELPLDAGDFRLIDREVAEVLRTLREENRYLRGMVSWCGFPQVGVPYQRDRRYAGKTKFSLKRMLRFAIDGILSFSDKPLKLTSYLGFVITAGSFLLGINMIIGKLVHPTQAISGWTSLIVVILFVGGVQLLSLGVMGLYIGRQYKEMKNRPLYVVAEKCGFEEPAAMPHP